jgi:hypothetical protein
LTPAATNSPHNTRHRCPATSSGQHYPITDGWSQKCSAGRFEIIATRRGIENVATRHIQSKREIFQNLAYKQIMLNYHIIVGRIAHDRPARIFSFRPTGIILVTVRKPWKPKEVYIDKFHSTTLMRVTAAQRCKAPALH